MVDALVEALHVDPATETDLDAFARLAGHWRLEWRGRRSGETDVTAVGDLSVGVVLGGRAVQDVWAVPGPDQVGFAQPPRGFYGTTVRMPLGDGRWRSTWMDVVSGRVRVFCGELNPGGIDLLSTEADPWLRWCFRDVEPDSFRWTGEYSDCQGNSWLPDDEMFATRVQRSQAARNSA